MNPKFNNIPSGLGGSGMGGLGNNRKGSEFFVLLFIIGITIFFNIRGISNQTSSPQKEPKPDSSLVDKDKDSSDIKDVVKSEETKETEKPKESENVKESEAEESSESSGGSNAEKEEYLSTNPIVNVEYLIPFDGNNHSIAINAGFAEFNIDDFFNGNSFDKGWVEFSRLDSLNRPQTARAFVTKDSLSNKERIEPSIKPAGFKNTKIDSKNAYYKLFLINQIFTSSDTSIEQNILTSTYEMANNDSWGLPKYEDIILKAVNEGESVLLEVTPIYNKDNLIAEGIQVRAISYGSDALDFNVFIYNVQENLKIDYGTGDVSKK